jgi:hypothetical protein
VQQTQRALSARTSLGDPKPIRFRKLAYADEHVLVAYLDRHTGNETFVKEALLSFAARSYRRSLALDDVLARHCASRQTLLDLTRHLRRRLGGGPELRGRWTALMPARPECPPELLRLLPAWPVLKARGPRYDTTHPAVAAYVTEALGDCAAAWQRFAASHMSHRPGHLASARRPSRRGSRGDNVADSARMVTAPISVPASWA